MSSVSGKEFLRDHFKDDRPDHRALCPACGVRWGIQWPPISLCPPCQTPANLARRPRLFPPSGATIDSERPRWRALGWDIPETCLADVTAVIAGIPKEPPKVEP